MASEHEGVCFHQNAVFLRISEFYTASEGCCGSSSSTETCPHAVLSDSRGRLTVRCLDKSNLDEKLRILEELEAPRSPEGLLTALLKGVLVRRPDAVLHELDRVEPPAAVIRADPLGLLERERLEVACAEALGLAPSTAPSAFATSARLTARCVAPGYRAIASVL